MSPKRIQLSRKKGYRKPEGAVVVSRPSKWGNPFLSADIAWAYPSLTSEQCFTGAVERLRELIRADRPITLSLARPDGTRVPVTHTYPSVSEIREELGGRDLACWCPASQPCHVDLLLEIANMAEPKVGG